MKIQTVRLLALLLFAVGSAVAITQCPPRLGAHAAQSGTMALR